MGSFNMLQYDEQRIPECKYGLKCNIKGCPFRHMSLEEKPECSNYKLGFCSYGAKCRFRYVELFNRRYTLTMAPVLRLCCRHIKRGPEELPAVSELWTEGNQIRNKTQEQCQNEARNEDHKEQDYGGPKSGKDTYPLFWLSATKVLISQDTQNVRYEYTSNSVLVLQMSMNSSRHTINLLRNGNFQIEVHRIQNISL